MKNINTFSILNKKPKIIVSNKTLQAIKHIVSIAPQEAQWFHTVTTLTNQEDVFLHLSETLYIPKQNTSAAQVDSSSAHMIEFYNELKGDHTQEEVNHILSTMTCWCHSHHNMNPSPSGQDNSQFNFFVNSALNQNQTSWQIMLIFNKKDNFYSRVFDPTTGVVYEGVEIIQHDDYDFSYIDKAAKEKFIVPKPKPKLTWGSGFNLTPVPKKLDKEPLSTWSGFDTNEMIANDLLAHVYPEVKNLNNKAKLYTKKRLNAFLNYIQDALDPFEMEIFLKVLQQDKVSIRSHLYSNSYTQSDEQLLLEELEEFMKETNESVLYVKDAYLNTLNMFDLLDDQQSLDLFLEAI